MGDGAVGEDYYAVVGAKHCLHRLGVDVVARHGLRGAKGVGG